MKFEDLAIGDEFIYRQKKYRKIEPEWHGHDGWKNAEKNGAYFYHYFHFDDEQIVEPVGEKESV